MPTPVRVLPALHHDCAAQHCYEYHQHNQHGDSKGNGFDYDYGLLRNRHQLLQRNQYHHIDSHGVDNDYRLHGHDDNHVRSRKAGRYALALD